MPMINIICPKCGGQAQVEAGRSAMCPYCAYELNASQADPGFAFAQDMQFAENMQAAEKMQFEQQPVREMQPAQADFYGAPIPAQPVQQVNPAQFRTPMPYTPAQLSEAMKKRGRWYFLNVALLAIPTLVLALGIGLEEFGSDLGVPLILSWLLAQPLGGILSGTMRPDEAYIDKKPLFKHRSTQGFMHFILSLPATAAAGGILFAVIEAFADLL